MAQMPSIRLPFGRVLLLAFAAARRAEPRWWQWPVVIAIGVVAAWRISRKTFDVRAVIANSDATNR